MAVGVPVIGEPLPVGVAQVMALLSARLTRIRTAEPDADWKLWLVTEFVLLFSLPIASWVAVKTSKVLLVADVYG